MERVRLTLERIKAFACPEDKEQAFLWDSEQRGLGIRCTARGEPAFIFQFTLRGRSVRMTIGGTSMGIDAARKRVREIEALIDAGRDPRVVKREQTAADEAKQAAERAAVVTVGDVWGVYLAEGKPRRKDGWKPRYVEDMRRAAAPGGESKGRGKGETKPGHLYPLLARPMASLSADVVIAWFKKEAKRSPVQATRAAAMLAGMLRWAAAQPEFKTLVLDRHAASSETLGEFKPATKKREDCVERSQLGAFFAALRRLRNPTQAAYLQALVLTGARREEMAALKWADIDFKWKTVRLADKVGDYRVIPLTPHLETIVGGLPRVTKADGSPSPYVFAGTSSRGYITEPRSPLERVCKEADIAHVTVHGLRRTYITLSDSAGVPAGVAAQIAGHRPSATHEGYKVRSIDDLRPHAVRIEKFILKCAGVKVSATVTKAGLTLVR